jgi:hypothetical protein
MTRPIALLTVLLLSVIGLLQVARAAIGLDVNVGGLFIAPVASWIAGLGALTLAVGLWWETWPRRANRGPSRFEARRDKPPAPSAAPGPQPGPQPGSQPGSQRGLQTASHSEPQGLAPHVPATPPASGSRGKGQFESVTVDGRAVPAAYFMFASKTLSIDRIKQAKAKYGRVLVGFDAGAIPMTGEITEDSVIAARDIDAELEIYVEGPGGVTGNTWNPGEMARVKAAAMSVGIDTSKPKWREQEWNRDGWKVFTFQQLAYYRKIGFNAGEIDNLEYVLLTPDARIDFYKEYAARQSAGELPQLVLKNIPADDMTRIVAAVTRKELPRSMFSEFHIFECEDRDDWREVDEISKAIAIRTVPSRDTYNYDAKGTFGLGDTFDELHGQKDRGQNDRGRRDQDSGGAVPSV